jgi:outer membrane protein assembly factor BamB
VPLAESLRRRGVGLAAPSVVHWMTKAPERLRYPESEEATMAQGNLFIGIKGTVLAIDRATGETVWETQLADGGFVNVVLDGSELYAATQGELYRLDPASGEVLWNNGLKGKGYGLIAIAQAAIGNWSAMEEKRRQDAAAAASTTAATM